MSAGAAGRYRRVLTTPDVAPLMAAAYVARASIGIDALAIVLFLREQGASYAFAGAVAAALAVGVGVGSPVDGRLVDRFGPRRVLPPLCLLHGAGLLGLVALGTAGAPRGILLLDAFLAGAVIPPVSSVLRTLWPRLLRDDPGLTSAAFALDGVVVELIFVLGPLIVAAATLLVAPQAALVLSVALVVGGTLAFVACAPVRGWQHPPGRPATGRLGALASPGMRTIVLTSVPSGFCFGAIEVTMPAFAEADGDRAAAGVLLACWALASASGGLAYGARDRSGSLATMYVRLALLLPLGYLPLAAAGSAPVMALLLLPAGAMIAPLLSCGNQLVGDFAPPGSATEAYTWPITSLVVGIATGNAVAGWVVEAADWRAACLAAAGVAALGGLAAASRRTTLSPPGPAG